MFDIDDQAVPFHSLLKEVELEYKAASVEPNPTPLRKPVPRPVSEYVV